MIKSIRMTDKINEEIDRLMLHYKNKYKMEVTYNWMVRHLIEIGLSSNPLFTKPFHEHTV